MRPNHNSSMSLTKEAMLIIYGAIDDQVVPKGKHWLLAFVLLKVLNLFYDTFAGSMFAVKGRQHLPFPVFPYVLFLMPELN